MGSRANLCDAWLLALVDGLAVRCSVGGRSRVQLQAKGGADPSVGGMRREGKSVERRWERTFCSALRFSGRATSPSAWMAITSLSSI